MSAFTIVRRGSFTAAILLLAAVPVLAQQTISGQVRHAVTQKPIANVAIIIEGTSLVAVTDAEGKFSIPSVPPGAHHVVINHPGFVPLRPEVTVGAVEPPALDVLLCPVCTTRRSYRSAPMRAIRSSRISRRRRLPGRSSRGSCRGRSVPPWKGSAASNDRLDRDPRVR